MVESSRVQESYQVLKVEQLHVFFSVFIIFSFEFFSYCVQYCSRYNHSSSSIFDTTCCLLYSLEE